MATAKVIASESGGGTAQVVAGQVDTGLAAAAERINALLPQTQCTKCGFDGCAPYAQAIARGDAAINRCPPGGDAGIVRLAALTGQAVIPLAPECGTPSVRQVAWINPHYCIGCTLCIAACPVDAIIGAAKAMHAVLPEQCTGCDLCLAPCPVDCIELRPITGAPVWSPADASASRGRFERRQRRLAKAQRQADASARKRAVVAAAIATAKARLKP
jgi:Na+-translocating ferredoxin:NAD+ oxidoreductase subunit B